MPATRLTPTSSECKIFAYPSYPSGVASPRKIAPEIASGYPISGILMRGGTIEGGGTRFSLRVSLSFPPMVFRQLRNVVSAIWSTRSPESRSSSSSPPRAPKKRRRRSGEQRRHPEKESRRRSVRPQSPPRARGRSDRWSRQSDEEMDHGRDYRHRRSFPSAPTAMEPFNSAQESYYPEDRYEQQSRRHPESHLHRSLHRPQYYQHYRDHAPPPIDHYNDYHAPTPPPHQPFRSQSSPTLHTRSANPQPLEHWYGRPYDYRTRSAHEISRGYGVPDDSGYRHRGYREPVTEYREAWGLDNEHYGRAIHPGQAQTEGYDTRSRPPHWTQPRPSQEHPQRSRPDLQHGTAPPVTQQTGQPRVPAPDLEEGAHESVEERDERRRKRKEALEDLETCPLYAGEEDDEEHNFPDGFDRRKFIKGDEVKGVWNFSKWVLRSRGSRKWQGDSKAQMSECLGLFWCTKCRVPFRPKTKDPDRKAQLTDFCIECGDGRLTASTPQCPAKTYTYTYHDVDEEYRVWEHVGFHNHPRPPDDGYFSSREKVQIVDVVQRNPTTNAARLRKHGGDAPGSQPLTKVSRALHDQNRLRYQKSLAQQKLGFTSNVVVKGGFSFLSKLFHLNSTLDEPFIVDSGFHDICFFQMQTQYMRDAIARTVDDWLKMDPKKDTKHGLITDGNHSFYKTGVLLTTGIFDLKTLVWIPVLYTWVHDVDEAHHLPHFRKLNSIIIDRLKELGKSLEYKHLLNVSDHVRQGAVMIDFSNRTSNAVEHLHQLLGHASGSNHEIIDGIEELLACVRDVASAAEAREAGFYHPKGQRPKGKPNVRKNFGFNDGRAPDTHKTLSPKKKGTKSAKASGVPAPGGPAAGLFPEVAVTNPPSNPATNNPPANAATEKPAEEPAGGQLVPRKNTFRAPQHETGASKQKKPTGKAKIAILSYKWKENSCFIDSSFEALFQAYSSWDSKLRSSFGYRSSPTSYLRAMSRHFDTRIQMRLQKSPKITDLRNELAAFQEITRRKIFDVWKNWAPVDDGTGNGIGNMGDAGTWIGAAIKDGNNSDSLLSFFCISYEAKYHCSDGHVSTRQLEKPGLRHRFLDRLIPEFINGIGRLRDGQARNSVTLTEYYQHFIPVYNGASTPVHRELSMIECDIEGCSLAADPLSVHTLWPQTFMISSDATPSFNDEPEDGRTYALFQHNFQVNDAIHYRMVAAVEYLDHGPHYVVRVIHEDGKVSYYDDCANDGMLVPMEDSMVEECGEPGMRYYIFHRASEENVFIRSVTDLEADYVRLNPMPPVIHDYTHLEETLVTPAPPPTVPPPAAKPMQDNEVVAAPVPRLVLRLPPRLQNTPLFLPKPDPPLTVPPLTLPPLTLPQHLPSTPLFEPVADTDADLLTASSHSCTSCGVEDLRETEVIICGLCQEARHIKCMIPKHLSEHYEPRWDDDGRWCCPQCTELPGGRWDQAMLGRFVLIDLYKQLNANAKTRMLYPAEIISHTEGVVTLQWHKFNKYDHYSPASNEFTLSREKCIEALTQDVFWFPLGTVGSINWPPQLHENAHDSLGYHNPALEEALADAVPEIIKIVTGGKPHPMLELLEQWIDKYGGINRRLTDRNRSRLVRDSFFIPIFPGDESLVEPFVLKVYEAVREHTLKPTPDGIRPLALFDMETCARILLRVVAARHYLGRDPCHDLEIFQLSRTLTADEYRLTLEEDITLRGSLRRVPSVHEKAFESSLTVLADQQQQAPDENGRILGEFSDLSDSGYTRRIDLREYLESEKRIWLGGTNKGSHLNRVTDKSLPLLDCSQRIEPLTEHGEPYHWSTAPVAHQAAAAILSSSAALLHETPSKTPSTPAPHPLFRVIRQGPPRDGKPDAPPRNDTSIKPPNVAMQAPTHRRSQRRGGKTKAHAPATRRSARNQGAADGVQVSLPIQSNSAPLKHVGNVTSLGKRAESSAGESREPKRAKTQQGIEGYLQSVPK
ncbi:hypothetical protein NMY22_g13888 [Coprinellus aureogranulatus]|nr:hypothetical protein NMY22_g13888 [Coprinellus aureogranulatus]